MERIDKIVCVGKNYAEHAKELGDAVPEKPVLFLKPASVLRAARLSGESLSLTLPEGAGAIHHECEIVLLLSEGGYRLDEARAARAIGAVSVGLDMTLRDRQGALKKAGHPWTVSKVFPDAAVVGPWAPVADFREWQTTPFTLTVGGKQRQEGRATEMILSPAACVAYISEFFPLCAGDLIFTGTPKGVGPVVPGDRATLAYGPLRYEVAWR